MQEGVVGKGAQWRRLSAGSRVGDGGVAGWDVVVVVVVEVAGEDRIALIRVR
jgi:hypothetical protein